MIHDIGRSILLALGKEIHLPILGNGLQQINPVYSCDPFIDYILGVIIFSGLYTSRLPDQWIRFGHILNNRSQHLLNEIVTLYFHLGSYQGIQIAFGILRQSLFHLYESTSVFQIKRADKRNILLITACPWSIGCHRIHPLHIGRKREVMHCGNARVVAFQIQLFIKYIDHITGIDH